MSFALQRADECAAGELHAALVAAFADYLIGPLQMALDAWPGFLARQRIDLALSRVVRAGGAIAAFAFVAPRPQVQRWRLATMGAVPSARGSGAAKVLLDDFIARAAIGAPGGTELEAFAQNERALRLYRGRGFEPRHELHGWNLAAAPFDGEVAPVQAVEHDDALQWLHETDAALPELPLQVTAAVIGALERPLQFWRHGRAQVAFRSREGQPLQVLSLIDRDRAQHDAFVLLQALRARHGAQAIVVPALQRADVGGDALARAGFERQPLHQLWMRRTLGTRTPAGE